MAGSWDVGLTATGLAQARAAAELLADAPIARVVTSDLRRAVETARVAAEARGLPVERLADLGERDWGPFQRGPADARPPGLLDPPGVEPWGPFAERVLSALAGLGGAGPALVVAHGGVFRVVAEAVGAPDAPEGLRNAIPCWIDPIGGEISAHRRQSVTGAG